MSNMTREAILTELGKYRAQLLTVVNNIDALMLRAEHEPIEDSDGTPYELIYPLSIAPAVLKGTKPTALLFGEERVTVKSWRTLYSCILRRCADDPVKSARMINLRNKIQGRKRTILSDKPDGMSRPVKLAEDLFAEAYFDTECMLRILTTALLGVIGYDYSGISVAVVNGKRRSR